MNPQWAGQEAAAFPDNWTIGMSFYHNVFAREHNLFVDAFRDAGGRTRRTPIPGCAIPREPDQVIRYQDVTPDELFEVGAPGRLGGDRQDPHHEWTPQLLYDEPLYRGMNANWTGSSARQGAGVGCAGARSWSTASASRPT